MARKPKKRTVRQSQKCPTKFGPKKCPKLPRRKRLSKPPKKKKEKKNTKKKDTGIPYTPPKIPKDYGPPRF